MHKQTITLALVALTGCHSPSGGIMPSVGGSITYYSTELMQKTVTVIDTRNDDVVFSIDIPANKQLTIDFDADEGDDPVNRPDVMRYEVMDLGTKTGKLHNQMTVPNAVCRRVDVTLHRGVQYAGAPPQRALRTDELADRPDWWTPQGGPLPEDTTIQMYDD